ncbi:PfkB family carbohydrate kinase [Natrinema sp. 1APR25-10V2]|uniref:PfkB family carbohydrate kinase n=1 Tax=Natrinema sp. 1APR25-10V2 TaxID=2951081 RepID=UPI0028750F9D|nr:PfkB family carbohydrate kinase [Natrinema sp. 1APR25-10V2]MDS0477130.1 PfkB family carbohydrate kinase [Natrinema sp. 1APR25-10V2]
MGDVVSLGSINVDKIHHVSDAEITDLRDQYGWFPDRGQTVQIRDLPTDFVADPGSIRQGGKGANQAVAAAKAGAETEMLGKVGPDGREFGVRSRLTEVGVGVTRIGTASEPTGTAHVFVGQKGDNRIIVRPGANSAIDSAYIREQYDTIRSAECLLLQNEIPIEPVVALLSELAADEDRPTVVLDPAPADGIEELLGCDAVDYLTPNENEYRALQSSLGAFDGVLVRKRGADDVIVEAERRFTVTPPTVKAIDTTGAGDVLNGFLAAQLAAGASLQEAIEIGTIAGSLSTRETGARRGIPTLEDVRTYRASEDVTR